MAGTVVITITGVGDTVGFGALAGAKQEALAPAEALLVAIRNGVERGAAVRIATSTTTGVQASGTLTLSTASGTVGASSIGGTSVTVTASGGDTATATALAAAINANSTVNKFVTATSSAGVVTVTANAVGEVGNRLALVATGTGVTASGALLTGGLGQGQPIRYI